MQKGVRVQILDGTPKGWRILNFPGRAQPYTIQQDKNYTNDRHASRHWRTYYFCATEREAWAKLKVIAG